MRDFQDWLRIRTNSSINEGLFDFFRSRDNQRLRRDPSSKYNKPRDEKEAITAVEQYMDDFAARLGLNNIVAKMPHDIAFSIEKAMLNILRVVILGDGMITRADLSIIWEQLKKPIGRGKKKIRLYKRMGLTRPLDMVEITRKFPSDGNKKVRISQQAIEYSESQERSSKSFEREEEVLTPGRAAYTSPSPPPGTVNTHPVVIKHFKDGIEKLSPRLKGRIFGLPELYKIVRKGVFQGGRGASKIELTDGDGGLIKTVGGQTLPAGENGYMRGNVLWEKLDKSPFTEKDWETLKQLVNHYVNLPGVTI